MKGALEILAGKRFPNVINLINSSRFITGSSISNRKNCNNRKLNNLTKKESGRSYATDGPRVRDVFKELYDNPRATFEKIFRMWREDFQLFAKEVKYNFSDHLIITKKGEINMLFTFDHDKCLDNWIVSTDSKNNQGYSTASFVRTNNETALFSGVIDTRVPQDGVTKYAGFANILTTRLLKSFRRYDTYDWMHYTHLVIKLRGDGRTYMLILGCPERLEDFQYDQFHYPLYTRGGPYWQIAKIPFSNFYFACRGTIQDRQSLMNLNSVSRVGITVADGIDGPFKIEIEYFGLEYQSYHKSICPYEMYNVGKNVAD